MSIEPIEVSWSTSDLVAHGVLRRPKATPVEHPGRIVDVSVTGAGIEGPRHPDLQVRRRAVVVYEGGRSTVLVRRLHDTDRPDVVFYGVELEELHPALREAIYQTIGRGRPGEQTWRRSL